MPLYPQTRASLNAIVPGGRPPIIPLSGYGHTIGFLPQPVAPYVGPGDVVSGAVGWWGLRAYSAATAGTKSCNIRRSGGSTPTQQDFNTLANGNLDVASIATFKAADGSTNLWITTLYDKSGNGNDVSQSNASFQPGFSLAIIGSLPAIDTTGAGASTIIQTTSASVSLTLPYTISLVANFTAATDMISSVFRQTAGAAFRGPRANVAGVAGNMNINNGGDSNTITGVASSTWHTFQVVYDAGGGTTGTLCINGTDNSMTGMANLGLTLNEIYFLNFVTGSFPWVGYSGEFGIWNSGFSSGQRTSMNSNQRTYWGF